MATPCQYSFGAVLWVAMTATTVSFADEPTRDDALEFIKANSVRVACDSHKQVVDILWSDADDVVTIVEEGNRGGTRKVTFDLGEVDLRGDPGNEIRSQGHLYGYGVWFWCKHSAGDRENCISIAVKERTGKLRMFEDFAEGICFSGNKTLGDRITNAWHHAKKLAGKTKSMF